MSKILITGCCGFIASNLIHQHPNLHQWVGIDKLVEPYNAYNLHPGIKNYLTDFTDKHIMERIFQLEEPEIILHFGAESFVDLSITNCLPFCTSNIYGTQVLLDLAVKYKTKRFILISTDETLGQLQPNEPSWTEESPANPRNPYAASKLASEYLVKAAHQQHGLEYVISRCSNTYGSRQALRNLIPVTIHALQTNQPINLHDQGKPYREWIYVEDHNSAILKLLTAKPNQIYNIGSGIEMSNLELVNKIGEMMGKTPKIEFKSDRKGQDFRYSLNCDKLKKIGWEVKYTFEQGMNKTIEWYLSHPEYFKIGRD